jgi:hypothetical protein
MAYTPALVFNEQDSSDGLPNRASSFFFSREVDPR